MLINVWEEFKETWKKSYAEGFNFPILSVFDWLIWFLNLPGVVALRFPQDRFSCCGMWPQWEGKKLWRVCFGFLCAFQLYSVLDYENTPEFWEEQGQFSPGVNSKESLQETLEMDCRMEALPHFPLLSAVCDCIHSLWWQEAVYLTNGEVCWCERGGRLYLDRAMVK